MVLLSPSALPRYGTGLVATAVRKLVVVPRCPLPDQKLCADYTCVLTTDTCEIETQRQAVATSTAVNQAPSIALVQFPELTNVARVPRFYGYRRCTTTVAGDPQVPLYRQPCEPGAMAFDFEDGGWAWHVHVCLCIA